MRTDRAGPGRDRAPTWARGTACRGSRRQLPVVVEPLRHCIRHLRLAAGRRVPGRARARRRQQGPGPARRVNAGRLVARLLPEALSLFCYGLLTQALLPPGAQIPSLSRLFRIDLAAAAVAHVIPAVTAGQRRHRVPTVHRRGHQGPRRRGDDGDQGPGLDRGAERPAVAVPGHLHPAGRFPPGLRDRGRYRGRAAARDRGPGLRDHRQSERASRILRAIGNRIPA